MYSLELAGGADFGSAPVVASDRKPPAAANAVIVNNPTPTEDTSTTPPVVPIPTAPAVAPALADTVDATPWAPAIPPAAGTPSAVVPPTSSGTMKARRLEPTSVSSANTAAHSSQVFRCCLTAFSSLLLRVPRTIAGRCFRASAHCSESPDWAFMCAERYAWRSPSRARIARADTAFGVIPRIGAISRGASPSTSTCQSTILQRSGKD